MENIIIIGSTGSIGRQTIEVLQKNPGHFKVLGLAAKNEIEIISSQIKQLGPEAVNVADLKTAGELSRIFPKLNVSFGERGLINFAVNRKTDSIVFAASGIVSLEPLLEAIKNKKRVLLANKEILIAAGETIVKYLDKYRAELVPIDSEHSALFQCLKGEAKKEVKNLILTCSGGPFRNYPGKKLRGVTVKDVLSHPVWKMGPKITVDSATLLNKGFEALEAHYLFRVPLERIKVVVHPECVVHSMVEFQDGSTKALLSIPDMRLPIQYALFHPKRLPGFLKPLDLIKIRSLTFLEPDTKKFPCLNLAYWAGKIGGTMPASLVFADEIVVNKFLAGEIKFTDIPRIIKKALKSQQPILNPSKKEILKAEQKIREQINKIL